VAESVEEELRESVSGGLSEDVELRGWKVGGTRSCAVNGGLRVDAELRGAIA
jgi:hypothetical protein